MSKHWSEKYLGILYDAHKFTCVDFIEMVLRQEFNIDIEFPSGGVDLFDQTAAIRKHKDTYVEEIKDFEDGCVILMEGPRRLLHVGLGVLENGKYFCLHCTKTGLVSRLDETSSLCNMYLKIVGFYKWR